MEVRPAKNKKSLYSGIKRGFDLISAAAMLGLTSPLFLIVSAMIKKESGGPVIFVHERTGLGGRSIRVYKFRSMIPGAGDAEAVLSDEELEEYYLEYKLRNDPRVTETGRILRRTCLDELPQLFNILLGQMSMVGPRPVMKSELDFYSEAEAEKLLSVKPGLTGYWQVYGKGSATYQNGGRQRMELSYADRASLMLDALILLRTPLALLKRINSADD